VERVRSMVERARRVVERVMTQEQFGCNHSRNQDSARFRK
jgi:hypothetical protein